MDRRRGLRAPMICRMEDSIQGNYCAMSSGNSEEYSICRNGMTSYFSICHMYSEICKFKDINNDIIRITNDINGITENINKITGSS